VNRSQPPRSSPYLSRVRLRASAEIGAGSSGSPQRSAAPRGSAQGWSRRAMLPHRAARLRPTLCAGRASLRRPGASLKPASPITTRSCRRWRERNCRQTLSAAIYEPHKMGWMLPRESRAQIGAVLNAGIDRSASARGQRVRHRMRSGDTLSSSWILRTWGSPLERGCSGRQSPNVRS
jgi:hypothetical protein